MYVTSYIRDICKALCQGIANTQKQAAVPLPLPATSAGKLTVISTNIISMITWGIYTAYEVLRAPQVSPVQSLSFRQVPVLWVSDLGQLR